MKNKKIVLISISVLVIIIFIVAIIIVKNFNSNPTIRAIVVRNYGKSITVMDIKDKDLYSIGLPEEINKQFKQGQEVLIYIDGEAIITLSNPAQIDSDDVKKIEIVKESSDTQIPEYILRRVYNRSDNISISIDEFLPTKLTLTIKDTNPYKIEYKYSNDYYISHRNNSEGNLQKNEFSKIESIKINDNTIKNIYNWENVYGKLESGEYILETSASGERMHMFIAINFTVNSENETVIYEEPMCAYTVL